MPNADKSCLNTQEELTTIRMSHLQISIGSWKNKDKSMEEVQNMKSEGHTRLAGKETRALY